MISKKSPKNKQRGNILFLILLAVVLFAALTYAVGKSMNVKEDSYMSDTEARNGAARLTQWFAEVENALHRMVMVQGIPLDKVDFYDTNNFQVNNSAILYNNSNCNQAVDQTCMMFSPAGGGASNPTFERWAVSNPTGQGAADTKPGHKGYRIARFKGVGTDANDLYIIVPYMSKKICEVINAQNGLPNCPVTDNGSGGVNVNFENNVTTRLEQTDTDFYGINNTSLLGKRTFCLCSNSNNFGIVYNVIYAR